MVYNRGNDKINICLDQESGTYSLELQGELLRICARPSGLRTEGF